MKAVGGPDVIARLQSSCSERWLETRRRGDGAHNPHSRGGGRNETTSLRAKWKPACAQNTTTHARKARLSIFPRVPCSGARIEDVTSGGSATSTKCRCTPQPDVSCREIVRMRWVWTPREADSRAPSGPLGRARCCTARGCAVGVFNGESDDCGDPQPLGRFAAPTDCGVSSAESFPKKTPSPTLTTKSCWFRAPRCPSGPHRSACSAAGRGKRQRQAGELRGADDVPYDIRHSGAPHRLVLTPHSAGLAGAWLSERSLNSRARCPNTQVEES